MERFQAATPRAPLSHDSSSQFRGNSRQVIRSFLTRRWWGPNLILAGGVLLSMPRAPVRRRGTASLPYAVRAWTIEDGLPTSTVQTSRKPRTATSGSPRRAVLRASTAFASRCSVWRKAPDESLPGARGRSRRGAVDLIRGRQPGALGRPELHGAADRHALGGRVHAAAAGRSHSRWRPRRLLGPG